ncbi:MAG: hypothetical protein DHS20C18_24210 [Saprospiraceae bacterium]|nr:MAG: hypothetical protein DHS20C18_24210 [Saprospiraceae bacterium]
MKNILFPTDFSDTSLNAFVYALRIAKKWKAKITTLHVYQRPEIRGAAHMPNVMEAFYNSIDLYEFENYRDAIPPLHKIAEAEKLDNLEINHILEEGDHTVKTILKVAQKEDAALIVLGTTGAHALKGIFMGSVAGEVLENAHCPVLAIPAKGSFDGKIDNIAFTVNFKPEEQIGLQKVINFADFFNAKIHCVHVDLAHVEGFSKRLDSLKTTFQHQKNIEFHLLEGTNLQHALSNYLTEHHIDVLAMVTHKRSWFQELFNYSKTKSMTYHTTTPILAIPEGALV